MTVPEPIHPGEHLAEIMEELGITQYRLAKTIGVPQIRIHDIVHCRRSITADTALRIGQASGNHSRLLAEPSADVRSGSGPRQDRRERHPMTAHRREYSRHTQRLEEGES